MSPQLSPFQYEIREGPCTRAMPPDPSLSAGGMKHPSLLPSFSDCNSAPQASSSRDEFRKLASVKQKIV